MQQIADGLIEWRAAGIRFAIATVVQTWRSAPRRPGAAMAVSEHGEVLGSVSGGCVESAVYAAAEEVLRTGRSQTDTYGFSDEDAFEVGLTCGGTIEVEIRPDTSLTAADEVLTAIRSGDPVATASRGDRQMVIRPHRVMGSLGAADLDHRVTLAATDMLTQGVTGMVEHDVFVQAFVAPARMIIFGSTDFVASLATIGRFLGFHVTVCDVRPVFTTPRRFPDADQVIVEVPDRYLAATRVDRRTVICALVHDQRFEIPLLKVALRGPARYVGALGSRRSHADRSRRLREAGMSEKELARLQAPIGLDLGARTPEEVAMAIGAEIIAKARGGSGRPLTEIAVPLHATTDSRQ